MVEQQLFTFKNNEKLYVLTFRRHSPPKRPNSQEIEDQMKNINWTKVKQDVSYTALTSVYTKIIKDEDFYNELQSLKTKLNSFRGNPVPEGCVVRFSLGVAIDQNDIGNPIDGLEYLFGAE
jgi:hypothetical protein